MTVSRIRRRCAALLAMLAAAPLVVSMGAAAQDDKVASRNLETARKRTHALESSIVAVAQDLRAATVAIFALSKVDHEGQTRLVRTSGGSGVIIDPKGYILSNDHVAGHCDAIEIVLLGGRRVRAELVAKDQKGDIVLLKMDGRRFPYVPLGDSDAVRVGEWVLAVGNPFFLGGTGEPVVTIGVVSAKDRVLRGVWEYAGSIQTDAEINPGNSGGPLFNMKGELIGINGKIATRQGRRSNTGAGYAIPIDLIKAYLPRLRSGKDIVRGYSGIHVHDRPVKRGVEVRAVDRGSPADRRGIEAGDVIVTVNGKAVGSAREYVNAASTLTIGKSLSLGVIRKGRKRHARIELEADPSSRRRR